jgi:methionine biosynthesis protein MetW
MIALAPELKSAASRAFGTHGWPNRSRAILQADPSYPSLTPTVDWSSEYLGSLTLPCDATYRPLWRPFLMTSINNAFQGGSADMDRPKYDLDGIFDPARAHPDDAHSILMRLIPDNVRVLELGCSSGYLSGYLEHQKNCCVVGVELDPQAASIAATRCSEVHCLNLNEPTVLDILHGPFDVLLAAAVLEHLLDPTAVLKKVYPKLTAEALIIVSLPNIAHWSVRWQLARGHFDETDYGIMDATHLHFYTRQSGCRLLENAGYRIRDMYIAGSGLQNLLNSICRHLGHPLPPPILPGLLGYELIYVATK